MAGLSKTLKRRATKRDTADTNVTAQDLREKKMEQEDTVLLSSAGMNLSPSDRSLHCIHS